MAIHAMLVKNRCHLLTERDRRSGGKVQEDKCAQEGEKSIRQGSAQSVNEAPCPANLHGMNCDFIFPCPPVRCKPHCRSSCPGAPGATLLTPEGSTRGLFRKMGIMGRLVAVRTKG